MDTKNEIIVPYHTSVMPNEVIQGLDIKPGGMYIDATFGGGGHTDAILSKEPTCKVLAFDWDKTALGVNEPALKEKFGERLETHWGNFASIALVAKKLDLLGKIDGIIADFGTSRDQLRNKPGFSWQSNTPLDMRMSNSHGEFTARNILAKASEEELATIFHRYGEERYSRKIARYLAEARKIQPIDTTKQLATLVEECLNVRGHQKIHPATRVFQALRIVVNHELDNIENFLKAVPSVLAQNGRIVCISFHSLEDRIVKNYFKNLANQGILQIVSTKPIVPTDEEVYKNPPSRSAKLRVAQKITT